MTSSILIHEAGAEHLPAIAEIHVKSWQKAYAGQINQSYLDKLDIDARLDSWRQTYHKNKDNSDKALFIAFYNDKPAGFIACGPARDEDCTETCEIYAAYILEEYWRQGIGFALYQRARAHFGQNAVYLWVLSTNEKAIASYQKWGGILYTDQVKDHTIGDQTVQEYRILFRQTLPPPL